MNGTWIRPDVSDWSVCNTETGGSNESVWLEDPETGASWLHKNTTVPKSGIEQGEDWSEVIATRVAQLVGVPCAETRLCHRNGRRGSISRNIKPKDDDLWEGDVVLGDANAPGYFPHREGAPGVDPYRPSIRRPGHSLPNIKAALESYLAPHSFLGPASMGAYDVFAGYAVLDALIANRDRHEQNWAVTIPMLGDDPGRLAASYDHASSLGFNLTDSSRVQRLDDDVQMEAWLRKGTAWRFEHSGRAPSLVDLADRAIATCSPVGAEWWRERLRDCSLESLFDSLHDPGIPEMSEPSTKFVIAVLTNNLRRLQDALLIRA